MRNYALLYLMLAWSIIVQCQEKPGIVITDDDEDNEEYSKPSKTQNKKEQRYFVIFDAGSSGTRVIVYTFSRQPGSVLGYDYESSTKFGNKPGLTAFQFASSKVRKKIADLLEFAVKNVPVVERNRTWCLLRATAGFRLISSASRNKISRYIAEEFTKSPFKVPDEGAVKMLSGKEEGLYAWVSMNLLTERFQLKLPTRSIVEMGGGSLQFAIQKLNSMPPTENSAWFRLQNGVSYHMHIHSYLGLGQKEALLLMSGYDKTSNSSRKLQSTCFASNFKQNFTFGSVQTELSAIKVNDNQRYTSCAVHAEQLVKNMNVHSEVLYLMETNEPIYMISGIYFIVQYFMKSFSKLNITVLNVQSSTNSHFNHRFYELTFETFELAARSTCVSVANNGNYEPYYCATAAMLTSFFKNGIKLKKYRILRAMGKNSAIGWTLGFSLHYLNQPSSNSASRNIDTGKSSTLTCASLHMTALLITVMLHLFFSS